MQQPLHDALAWQPRAPDHSQHLLQHRSLDECDARTPKPRHPHAQVHRAPCAGVACEPLCDPHCAEIGAQSELRVEPLSEMVQQRHDLQAIMYFTRRGHNHGAEQSLRLL